MSEWKKRPNVPESHPFREIYNDFLDSSREELLEWIDELKQDRNAALEEKKKGKRTYDHFIKQRMIDTAIEAYYWKFLNKETRIPEEDDEEKNEDPC